MPTCGVRVCAVAATFAIAGSAWAQTWNLASDLELGVNPNGAWSYGVMTDSVFTLCDSSWTGQWSTGPVWWFGVGGVTPAVGVNKGSAEGNGVAAGDACLVCDFLVSDARWTAPAAGMYDVSVIMGTVSNAGLGGSGANVSVDGVKQAYQSYVDNTKTWMIDEFLNQGDTVDASAFSSLGGGNIDTTFTVIAAPEPPELGALLLGTGWLAFRRRRA